MKKTITIITILILSMNLSAQTNDSLFGKNWHKTFALKINPLPLSGGFINVQAEKAITSTSSLNLIYVLGFRTNDGGGQGFSVGLEYRHYFTGAPTLGGAYLAPFARYRDISFFQTVEYYNSNIGKNEKEFQPIPYTNFGGGVVLGKQWAFLQKKLLFDLYGGIDYNTETSKKNPNLTKLPLLDAQKLYDSIMQGLGFRIGATIGYRF